MNLHCQSGFTHLLVKMISIQQSSVWHREQFFDRWHYTRMTVYDMKIEKSSIHLMLSTDNRVGYRNNAGIVCLNTLTFNDDLFTIQYTVPLR